MARTFGPDDRVAQLNIHFRVRFTESQPSHRGALDTMHAESIRQDLAGRYPESNVTVDYDYKLANE